MSAADIDTTLDVLPRAVLFDWDNTLVENWLSIQAAMNAALASESKAVLGLDQVIFNARHSGRDVFPGLFGEHWQRARDVFYAHFHEHHLAGLTIMPGALRLIDVLKEREIPLGIVSNKRGDLLRREIGHLGWTSRFAAVVGSQDIDVDKPDPGPVLHVLAGLRLSPSPDIWVVGDTDVDIRAGLAAGCSAVLIGPGPADSTLMDGLKPVQKFSTCDALAGFVRGLPDTISMMS